MKEDPTFKSRFGVSTPIQYIHHLEVESAHQVNFKKAWKRFYAKYPDKLVVTSRQKKFDSFLKKLAGSTDDVMCSNRIEIGYISQEVGYGVFAKEDIPSYSVLHHYSGIICLDKDLSEDNDSVFMFSDFPTYSINAQKFGNWSRYMNHTLEKEANVLAWEHYTENGPHIIFTACKKGIQKGKQLLYSYGDQYWDEEREFLKL